MAVSNTNNTKIDDLIATHFAEFDTLLASKDQDHSKIMNEASKLIMLLAHYGVQADHQNILEQQDEIWVRVHEVTGTYKSKTVLILTCISAGLTIVGGLTGLVSIVPGTSLGTSLAGKGLTFLNGGLATGKKIKIVGDSIGQFGQAAGMFPNIAEKVKESERVIANAHLDENKQKRQDRKDSQARNRQQQDRALQQAREADQKKSQIFTEMMRG